MKILITGAAGFMGSHLVDSLVETGKHQVFGIDDLSGGYIRNVNPKSQFTKLDLRDQKKTEKYIASIKPDLLYHLAADATEGRSQFTPLSETERNYNAYLNTLIPSIKNGLKRVVLTSSMSVYGGQKPPFSESLRRSPEDIYAIAKTAMEEATEILSKVHGFQYTIVRPHNVYGPKQNLADPYRNVIGIFINCILNNKHFYIYGDGQQKRAFTYIDDFNPYFIKTGFLTSTIGEIINIGPKEEYSINELSRVVLHTFFPDGNLPAHLKPKNLAFRPQEVKEAYCTNLKATKLLGYKTQTSLEQGVQKWLIGQKLWAHKNLYILNKG